ncbi:MAG: MFS transporter [Rhodocyclaceae bacterium]|nr:MAG: MFS transporter [Rhodocyclaceae bacterium]
MTSEALAANNKPNSAWMISYVAVVIAMMSLQMSSLGFAPLLPTIKQEFQMTFSQLGMFTGVYGLVALVMSVPAGVLAKQYGEKKVLATGLVILVIGLFFLAQAGSYEQALSARVLWLFGYRLSFVCVMIAIALTAPPNLKGRAMGILGAMSSLASVVGAPFCASIGEALGWRHAIEAFAGVAVLGLAIFWWFYAQKPEVIGSAVQGDGKSQGAFAAFKIPIVWTIPLLGLTNVGGFAATFFVPSVLKADFNASATDAAYLISVSYIAAIAVNPICGVLADRFNRWLVLAIIVALMIPASLAMTSKTLLIFQIGTISLISLGLASTHQLYPTIAELMRGRDVGPLMGITALGGGLFGYLGPQLLGWLRDWSGGFMAGWYALTGASVASMLLILFLKAYSERQSARLASQTAA